MINLTVINWKVVTTVVKTSAIQAWGKAIVAMGVIYELTLEGGLEVVVSAQNPTNEKRDEEKEDTNLDIRRESKTEEEHQLQNEIRAMKERLEKIRRKDREASITLGNAHLSCI